MLHAFERSELHTFGSFREIKTNSLSPRITDQQLMSFLAPMGSSKSRKTTISDFCENSLSQLSIVITREPFGRIQQYIYSSSANLKLSCMRATCKTFVVPL